MSTRTVTVHGMTCGHCVNAVTEELTALDGVESVEVDLVEGGDSPVRITSGRELSDDEIAGAVDEAGYHVV